MAMLAQVADVSNNVPWSVVAYGCIPLLGLLVKDYVDQRRSKRTREAFGTAADTVVKKTDDQTKQIVAKVDENTAVNTQAISEANNFNRKLTETKQENAALAVRLDKRIDDLEAKHEKRHEELKQLIEAIKPAA